MSKKNKERISSIIRKFTEAELSPIVPEEEMVVCGSEDKPAPEIRSLAPAAAAEIKAGKIDTANPNLEKAIKNERMRALVHEAFNGTWESFISTWLCA